MRHTLLYLKKLALWSAMILLALVLLAGAGAALRARPVDSLRVARAFLEQVGTFLPFAGYAAAFSVARRSSGSGAGWALAGGAVVAAASFLLLGLATALAPDPPAGAAAAWETHNRAAHAVFGALVVGIGAVAGGWVGRHPRAGGWEGWALGLVLLVCVLAGEMVSWALVLRHGVSAGPAVWTALLLVPALLLAAWVVPGWTARADDAA